jgi:hypothetical protein
MQAKDNLAMTNDYPTLLTFTISVLTRLIDDEWYLDVTEGFDGQPPTRTCIGPVPFEMLTALTEDVRDMHAKTIQMAIKAFQENLVSNEELAQRLVAAKIALDERNKNQHKLTDIAPYNSIYPTEIDWGRFGFK